MRGDVERPDRRQGTRVPGAAASADRAVRPMPRAAAAAMALAVLALLTVIALASRALPSASGPRSTPLPTGDAIDLTRWVGVGTGALVVLGACLIVWLLWPDEREWQPPDQPRSVLATLAALAIVTVVVYGIHQALQPPAPVVIPDDPPPPGPVVEEPAGRSSPTGSGAGLGLLGVAVGLAAFALVVAARAGIRAPSPQTDLGGEAAPVIPPAPPTSPPAPAWGPGHRGTILRAYDDMRTSMGTAGVAPGPAEAPREYLRRVTGRVAAAYEPAAELTALFERARFHHGPLTAADGQAAAEALERVRGAAAAAATSARGRR